MFTFIGIGIVLVATIVGYVMHKGNIMVLVQPNELVILGGAAFGSLMAGHGMSGVKGAIQGIMGLLKPDPYTKEAFTDLLRMMYQLFNVARKEGLLGLERHIENPKESDILGKYPTFINNHHATDFFCDTLKVILSGSVGPHDLSEMMELDLEVAHHQASLPVQALQTTSDAMPGFGIVAAVLGVIITMGKIGGEAAAIGMSVAGALVGTFLGILAAYGVLSPIAKALELRLSAEAMYMNCIRHALFSFARGEAPITCVEFARRNIEPTVRPGFTEMETAVKENKAA
jgi:chemotaxis protein MotA